MIIPIQPNAKHTYVLNADKELPEDQQTKFYFKYLSGRDKAAIALATKHMNKDNDESSLWMFSILQHSLTGWDNFKLADGTEYKWSSQKCNINGFADYDVMATKCFEVFQLEWVQELSSEAYKMNYMSAEEKKS